MITERTRTCYRTELCHRDYLSKKSAIVDHAKRMMDLKYPAEPYEYDTGAGFHWTVDGYLVQVFTRLVRILRYFDKNHGKMEPTTGRGDDHVK